MPQEGLILINDSVLIHFKSETGEAVYEFNPREISEIEVQEIVTEFFNEYKNILKGKK